MLFQPVTSQSLHHDLTAFLISRMNAHWHMSALLMAKHSTFGPHGELENRIIGLYTAVLSWQMKSICAYYRQQWNMFVNLPGLEYCSPIEYPLLNNERDVFCFAGYESSWWVVHYVQGLANTALSQEAKLRDMHLGYVPIICPACGELDRRIWRSQYHTTCFMDVQHAASGCSACMLIVRAVIAIVEPLDERARLEMTGQNESSLKVRYQHEGRDFAQVIELYVQQGMYNLFYR